MQLSKVRRRTLSLIVAAGVVMTALLLTPVASFGAINIGIGISVGTPPPVLPVYAQPICPGSGYIWTPGYWAYGPDGYYWVPGVWVMPPAVGMLWTPPYWGWDGGNYLFHSGYWGTSIGYYGGINYGYGYGGSGYDGGYWNNGRFMYNSAINRLGRDIRNTYSRPVAAGNYNRISYNGGKGGLTVRPNAREQASVNQRRMQPSSNQVAHEQSMRSDRNQMAASTNANPRTTAMPKITARPQQQQRTPAVSQTRSAPAASNARPAANNARPAGNQRQSSGRR